MKICIIVPVYDHEEVIPRGVLKLKVYGIPCLLVNDGSSVVCSKVLTHCAGQELNWIKLLTRHENDGKGAAVMDEFKEAIGLGFTHAIQIDANGQHDYNYCGKVLLRWRFTFQHWRDILMISKTHVRLFSEC